LSPTPPSDSLLYVEPISALLFIVATHGVNLLVTTLSGSSEGGALSAELFKALRESESRIDARLGKIENLLDKLLEQRYSVALSIGVQRFLDAADAVQATDRASDLEHARTAFMEASAAAQSCLEKAIAERYLLLNAVAQRRLDLAPVYLTAMESTATAAAFEAMTLTELKRESYEQLLRERRWPSGSDPVPQEEARDAALESLAMCGRLLAEGAALAPELDLPPRATPSTIDLGDSGRLSRRPDPVPMKAAARISSRFARPERIDAAGFVRSGNGTKPYWTFHINPGEVLRLGSMTLEVLTARDDDVDAGQPPAVAQLGLTVPLPKPIVMHWVHPEYLKPPSIGELSPSVPAIGKVVSQRPPPRPKLPSALIGWSSADPPTGIEVDMHTLKAELPVRPVASNWSNRSLDISTRAIRLNPSYIANHFIVVTTTH
jgi:hypothetical protein